MTNLLANLRMRLGAWMLPTGARISTSRELYLELTRGGTAITGASVTPETAMRVSAVSRCVRIIAGTIASMPLITYKRVGEGKERATDNPIYKILRYKPNLMQTSLEFRETIQAHALLRGAGYARKMKVRGRVDELFILHPDYMQLTNIEQGKLIYKYQLPGKPEETLSQDDLFRLTGLSTDGTTGRSVIDDHKESLGLALTQESYGAEAYASGATKRHCLSHPARLSADAAQRLRDKWDVTYGGQGNTRKVVVLEEGMKLEPIDMTPEDLEYIESRRFQIGDIARIFGVPLPLMQEGEKGTAWGSGIEQLSLMFLIYTLQPWLVRWEQAIQRDLLGQDQEEYFSEHLVDSILRPDIEKRFAAHAISIDKGIYNADEIRAMENKNAQPNGQGRVYHIASTMVPKDQAGLMQPAEAPAPAAPAAPAEPDQEDQ